MTTSELEIRLTQVETKLARLEEEVEVAGVRAGIQRGLAAADAGQLIPAREALEKFRIRHEIAQG